MLKCNGVFALIIDTHVHLGHINQFYFYDVSVSRMLKKMDSLNISACINAHNESLVLGNLEKGIIESKNAYEESEGRILNYFVYDPSQATLSLNLMEKCFNSKIFKGIKIHPSVHRTYADDSLYAPAWQFAADSGLPIMSHTWALSSYNDSQKYAIPIKFKDYIEKFPNVTFICGHSGGRYSGITEAAKLAACYHNVYLDTAGDVYDYGFIEYLAGTAGAGKILFGSDVQWFDPATQLGMVLGADLSEEDKGKILFRNAGLVFGIYI